MFSNKMSFYHPKLSTRSNLASHHLFSSHLAPGDCVRDLLTNARFKKRGGGCHFKFAHTIVENPVSKGPIRGRSVEFFDNEQGERECPTPV